MKFKATPSGTVCSDCNTVAARISFYDPDILGSFCPDCFEARLLKALGSKRITMEQLKAAYGRRFVEMSEEEILRIYVAANLEGLVTGDLT